VELGSVRCIRGGSGEEKRDENLLCESIYVVLIFLFGIFGIRRILLGSLHRSRRIRPILQLLLQSLLLQIILLRSYRAK
jgi:hypothetical protein